MIRRREWIGGLALAATAWPARRVLAHPFHATFAEVRHNAETNSLEVAMRVAPNDLEDALSRRVEGRVSLDRRADIDALITGYVRDVFVVTDGEMTLSPTWVGKEIESHQIAWLYFEFPLPADVKTVTVRNWAFFEIAAKQLNTVKVTAGSRKRTLTFSPGARQKAQRVTLAAPRSSGKKPKRGK